MRLAGRAAEFHTEGRDDDGTIDQDRMLGGARHACPGDKVVWFSTKSGIYHFKGERWFGNTRQGKYMCEHDADAEGDRPTHNGQYDVRAQLDALSANAARQRGKSSATSPRPMGSKLCMPS
jgi:hypothetical protein